MLLIIGAILAIILIGALYGIYKYITEGNQDYWPSRSVHLVKLNSIASPWQRTTFQFSISDIELKTYQAFKKARVQDFGGVMEFRNPVLVLMDPELIRHVLVKDFDHFVNRRQIDFGKANPLLNDMLINKRDGEWKDLRSVMSPTFSTGKIKQIFNIFQESSDKLAGHLRNRVQEEEGSIEVEFRDIFVRYTLDVIASTAFGIQSGTFQDQNSQFAKYTKRFQNQFRTPLGVLKIALTVMMPKVLNLLRIPMTDTEAMDFFSNVIKSSIALREGKGSGARRNDFLQLLIEAKKRPLSSTTTPEDTEYLETTNGSTSTERLQQGKSSSGSGSPKTPLTDDLILSQSILFFIGGFDTMETLLDAAVYELAVNPDIQEKLYEEIESRVAGSNGGKLTYEIIIELEYLDKVISETLRKYPPGIRLERQCAKDYRIPNSRVTIKKGDIVVVPVYGMHHDEDIWPEPEVFDPERFSPENKASRSPYVYLPFGAGPRNCIANRFALLEGKAAICELIHKFRLEPCSRTNIPMRLEKTSMKPDGEHWLKVTPRKS